LEAERTVCVKQKLYYTSDFSVGVNADVSSIFEKFIDSISAIDFIS